MLSDAPIPNTGSWPLVRLGDLCHKIGSGATPTGGSKSYLSIRQTFALVRSQNVFERAFSFEGLAYISDDQASSLRGVWLQRGDLLLNITGDGVTFGRSCAVPSSVLPACVNQHVAIVRLDEKLADPGYILAYLSDFRIKRYMESFNTGGSRRALTKGHIEAFIGPLPPLEEQRQIGALLGALDSRIEALKQTNVTLDAIARAIFKSWFVDFDPVKAKAEGREPEGMDTAAAALFPDSFEFSPDIPVPGGWQATTLGNEVERNGGRIQTGPFGSQLHASDYTTEGVPVVMPQDISARRVNIARIARVPESEAIRLSRHRLEAGDIVYSRRGDVERHAHITEQETGWLCGTGCLLVRTGSNWQHSVFLSLALDRPETKAWISQHAIGATMANLNTGILSAVPLIFPSENILNAFTRLAEPIEQVISANSARSGTLARLRDTLLPRLISGKLRVPQAEEMLAEVV